MGKVRYMILAAAAVLSACTTETPAPPLQGPSELGLALTIVANPDVLSQDGASQSLIVIQAYDPNGQPQRNVAFRAEITVNGVVTDFGSLSAKNLVTGNDGRAFLTYTAPAAPVFPQDTNLQVAIRIIPSAGNFSDTFPRVVNIRLVTPGVIVGFGPTPAFTFTPANPEVLTSVIFDASTSIPPATASLVSFNWDFGDGGTASGVTVTRQFSAAGTFLVRLTVTDSNGVSSSTSQNVTVAAGSPPSASFTSSPTSPTVGQTVFFSGEGSRPAAGRRIVRYAWRFGNGLTASGVTATTVYSVPGSYTVVLTVTDDANQQATTSGSVTVSVSGGDPSAAFTMTDSSGSAVTTTPIATDVTFHAGGSTSTVGISSYAWDFSDGTTGSGLQTKHSWTTPGTYVVRLTVRDKLGRAATTTRTLTVTP